MAIPERPDGRVENYLANLIGQDTAWEPGNPESRVEEYLDYILENGTKTEQEMEDDIAALKSIGRYLSLWNAATGLPVTNPKKLPYTYKTGDYYIVSNVDTTTNYMPSGIKYEGTASVTTDNGVKVNDYYVFDGTTWSRLSHSSSGGGGGVPPVPGLDGYYLLRGKRTGTTVELKWVRRRAVTITAAAPVGGEAVVDGVQSVTDIAGTEVGLLAIPSAGFVFSQWNDGNTDMARNVLIGDVSVTYTAQFVPEKVNVNISISPGQSGSVMIYQNEVYVATNQGQVDKFSNVRLNATANGNYVFSRWSNGSTDNPLYIEPQDNVTLTAIFEEQASQPTTYSVYYKDAGDYEIWPPMEDREADVGILVTISAAPVPGYVAQPPTEITKIMSADPTQNVFEFYYREE